MGITYKMINTKSVKYTILFELTEKKTKDSTHNGNICVTKRVTYEDEQEKQEQEKKNNCRRRKQWIKNH
jgi:hypothetical protein